MLAFVRHALAVTALCTALPCLADARAYLAISHIQTGIVSGSTMSSLFDQDTDITIVGEDGAPTSYAMDFSSGRALAPNETFFVNISFSMAVQDDGLPAGFAPGYVFPNDEFAPVSGTNDVALAWIALAGQDVDANAFMSGVLERLSTSSDSAPEIQNQFSFSEAVLMTGDQGTSGPQTIRLYAAVFAQGGDVSAVPEPATYALTLSGLLLLGLARMQRAKSRTGH